VSTLLNHQTYAPCPFFLVLPLQAHPLSPFDICSLTKSLLPFFRLHSTIDRPHSQSGYSHHSQHGSPVLNMIPETSQYAAAPRYQQQQASYAPSSGTHNSRTSEYRSLNHDPVSWNHTSDYVSYFGGNMLRGPSLISVTQYSQDRNMVVPHLANDPHNRYQ
jgi:hypothetical protein